MNQPTPVAASAPPPIPLATPAPPAPARPPQPQPVPDRPPTEAELFSRLSLAALNASRPLGDAFFEYDQATLSEDGQRVLQRDAAWLKQWNSTRIVIEGHADERGTAEYNLALGDRRARAARNYLLSLGITADRLRTVSYGKEFPFDPGHTETAWEKNRRAHFMLTAK
jgi:peptidoglycan-associated lipoprotein